MDISMIKPIESVSGKKIVAFNLDGTPWKVFNSRKEAALELGITNDQASSISQCLNGKTKKSYGYQWRYFSDVQIKEVK